MEDSTIVKLRDVSFKYDKEWVVKDVDLNIKAGQFLGLVGPNGSGKSTLIKLMLGLVKPGHGSIHLFNKPLRQYQDWQEIGFVSQKANSFNSGFPATVIEVVKTGLVSRIGAFKFFTKKHKEKAMDALRTVEMDEYAYSNIGELSGGQQQRVFIARALVSDPSLLILDEPTVGVDAKHVTDFYDLLGRLNKEQGITLLMVTHDIGTITDHATHVVCMNKTVHFHGASEEYKEFSEEDLNHLYGHAVQQLTHNHDHHEVNYSD
ncbi:zinc transport system ATP-binding protein [Halobacillus karajensis]|uniref:Zinc transport system ATP-binding protein AdcC n=1 Tax=Halobacillus karajensis TaxID=195088 RepID=A0A024P5Y5_9BACI|nr:metal ABC transporter ATP-binding protein [Halobacillus karajensis]CDQ20465.1 putative zinc transport system ATP-binding protein AdcC [Halobacillus karajensis]CDQ24066.1 putative zinc transport system ATP-binding protein AdcC [Halobacillus karajensis]CDQ27544.1 putative zinc transport system ATP-binding protein AdcC [Halobacillus karajensis]SEH91290.1 zinc transport system ATP-binding protein [Halobacillus karajensis]